MGNDVFISYRRDGGGPWALLIKSKLEADGYKVFLDLEDLDSGRFDEQLLKVIEDSENVIVILSKGAFERYNNDDNVDDDWVRNEIEHAQSCDKNIIPLIMPGFTWPDSKFLPESIKKFSRHEGINFYTEYADATIQKLEKLLKRTPIKEVPEPSKPPERPKSDGIVIREEDIEPASFPEVFKPGKKSIFGIGFTTDQKTSIVQKLEEMSSQLSDELEQTDPDAIKSYQIGRVAMYFVKEQLGEFDVWGFDAGNAINTFIKNYERNLSDVKRDIMSGKRYLDDENRNLLKQLVFGMDDILKSIPAGR